MGNFNMHKIKRMAHKQAWNDPNNPFARGGVRKASTFNGVGDVENNAGSSNLDHIYTAPEPRTSTSQPDLSYGRHNTGDGISSSAMTGANEINDEKPDGRSVDGQHHSSEETAIDRPVANDNHKGLKQRKILGIFPRKNKENEGDLKHSSTESSKKSKRKTKFTVGNQIKNTLFNSYINILLVAAPVGIGLHFTNVAPAAVFVVNFIAIIPLAALLSYATEELALRVGETLGGLLNASFGNAVELIVSIIALVKHEILIVKTSLIGSVLSNLLLVMGMCFFFGGLRREEQFFNVTVATTAASLLALAISSIIIPSAFNTFAIATDTTDTASQKQDRIAAISRGTALILLFVYGAYLFFQLKTHSAMYMQESQKVAMKPMKHKLPEGAISKGLAQAGGMGAGPGRVRPESGEKHTNDELVQPDAYEQAADDDDEDEPKLALGVAIGLLVGSTVIVALCAEFMVDSIGSITGSVSPEFVGLILLPIVGNAAEHATAVTVACKDKMDLAIGVAVGSSMQVALLVLPLMVVIGWGMNEDTMDLNFDGFLVAVLFVTVLLVNYLISDGKSHWLEGMLLQCLYVIIAVTAWFYPHVSLDG